MTAMREVGVLYGGVHLPFKPDRGTKDNEITECIVTHNTTRNNSEIECRGVMRDGGW